jgi:hypothetical protein
MNQRPGIGGAIAYTGSAMSNGKISTPAGAW